MSAANIPTIWKMSQDPCLPRTLCCPWLRFLHLGPGVPLRPGSQPSLASKPRTEILIILSVGLANSTSKPRTTEILSILSVGMANKPGFVSQVIAEAGHFLVPLHLFPNRAPPNPASPDNHLQPGGQEVGGVGSYRCPVLPLSGEAPSASAQ